MIIIQDQKTNVFIQAYRSFLTAEGNMHIDQVEQLYKEMHSSLHTKAGSEEIDIEAFMYSFLRLPPLMHQIKRIIMAQTDEIFHREGYKIEFWQDVHAPARRRKIYFDGETTFAAFINSVTDVDDVVCLLTAFQIEWNKMHAKLQETNVTDHTKVLEALGIDEENWQRISRIWDTKIEFWLEQIKQSSVNFELLLLRGSYVDYKKAAQRWFENIVERTRYKDLRSRPIYFVSSNTHSLVNNMTGWVTKLEKELIEYLKEEKLDRFLEYWEQIEKGEYPGSRENFLWYILKKYEVTHPEIKEKRKAFEQKLGIDFIEAKHYLDIDAQVIAVKDIAKSSLSDKLGIDLSGIKESNALIINIDYPLGAGAYRVLSTLLQNVNTIKGIYILGKASFLHANLGDIALPNTILDTYGENTYMFSNAFTKEYFKDFKSGSILINQKVVSSKGTLLHPLETIQTYFLNNYTIIEMENGPYLNAVFEMAHFGRYPRREMVSLLNAPVDVGIIHYASDTPFTKAITLGTRSLGYEGVEATYASSLAILRRIVEVELGK
ncbi:MAG TPA: hypothetical protein PLS49_06280 [Candidatus Woesebacteria bacterium]|nr:hypothetical protein [Candidatus Woesebacteria bacterium]